MRWLAPMCIKGPLLWLLPLSLLLIACKGESRQELEFTRPATLEARDQLLIRGNNRRSLDQTLVIRIDDREVPGYAERVNLERVIPPGPFALKLSLGGLHTPSGRALQLNRVRRMIVFQGAQEGGVVLEPLAINRPKPLLNGAMGWDLGPTGSALWPGFEVLEPGYPGLSGSRLKPIDRGARKQAAEGLTSDGINGIERLRLPLPRGRWFVTLWLRDPGEWEYLPHPLVRHIRANGQRVWSQQHSADSWINKVYLAGRSQDIRPDDDAWKLFGERPAERASFMVDVAGDGLQLAFVGTQPEAGFVAAILAERDQNYPARQQVEAERAHWWRNSWRIDQWPEPAVTKVALQPRQGRVIAAPDTTASLTFDLNRGGEAAVPGIEIEAPALNGLALETDLRWGQWHLQRSGLSSTLLTPSNNHLRNSPPLAQNAERAGEPPQRLHLRVRVPANAPAGRYLGSITVQVGERSLQAPLELEIAEVTLPPADRPIGVYLERPVHFDWFDQSGRRADQAMRCDLTFLRNEGLSGIAPPLTTPTTAAALNRFVAEIRATAKAGFKPPFLAYTPFKRLMAELGLEAALTQIARVERRLAAEGLPAPIWATADEPSNPGQANSVTKIRRYARAFAPAALLGGQLNHSEDVQYLDAFDVVLLNPGFGIDQKDIEAVKARGATPWLYNAVNLRAAAGFYLWRIGAQGYLQWHARMPTADPFDPTDGRESDVQFLYPMAQPCPKVPDVDARLFDLTEGITDLRWLLWLEQRAEQSVAARKVMQRLRDEIPDNWKEMEQITSERLERWRRVITELAQGSRKGGRL